MEPQILLETCEQAWHQTFDEAWRDRCHSCRSARSDELFRRSADAENESGRALGHRRARALHIAGMFELPAGGSTAQQAARGRLRWSDSHSARLSRRLLELPRLERSLFVVALVGQTTRLRKGIQVDPG